LAAPQIANGLEDKHILILFCLLQIKYQPATMTRALLFITQSP